MKRCGPNMRLLVAALALAACGQGASDDAGPAEAEPAASPAATTSRPATKDGGDTSPAATDPAATEPNEPIAAAPEKTGAPGKAPAPTPTPTPTSTPVAVAEPAAFRQCAVCHSTERGAKHRIGPNLFGVVGRAAGSSDGYAYSPALAGSGLTWNAQTLDAYLEAPAKLVPGTKMMFPGQKDPEKRKEIIDFLAGLK